MIKRKLIVEIDLDSIDIDRGELADVFKNLYDTAKAPFYKSTERIILGHFSGSFSVGSDALGYKARKAGWVYLTEREEN